MSKVITPEAILSYPWLFNPQPPMEGSKEDPKYGAVFVFDTEAQDTPEFKAMKAAAIEVAKEKWGTNAVKMLQEGKLTTPFRTDRDGYAEGSVSVGAKSKSPPGIVSIYPDENGKPSKIEDESKVYPGVIVRASMRAFAYDVAGNKGISFGLNNVQILRDGDRLDGRVAAQDEFEADMDAVASLDDLTDESGEGEPAAVPEAEGADLDLAELL